MDSGWTLQLDDEGYPVMDGGIRGDEEEFLKLVFQNLRRFENSDRQCLVTTMGDKEVFISSFDDPLIAQAVTFAGKEVTWHFLGDLKFKTNVDDILVDEWQRLHAYVGPEKYPAVMSHRAQADFLLKYPALAELKPQPYRRQSAAPDWQDSYETGCTPWDMGTVNPVFTNHADRMFKETGKQWLLPGAGKGHEIPFFEKAGKEVLAVDLAPGALESFKQLYPSSPAKFIIGDFFTTDLPVVDAIVEKLFFIAIDPALRAQAVQRIHSLLKPGGMWGGAFLTRYADGGPPFGLSEWELRAHTEKLFDVVEWVRSPHSHPRRRSMELWAVLKKK